MELDKGTASLLYALSVQKIYEDANGNINTTSVALQDDFAVVGSEKDAIDIFSSIESQINKSDENGTGLVLQYNKCRVFWPHHDRPVTASLRQFCHMED